jgi:hypothetical protein
MDTMNMDMMTPTKNQALAFEIDIKETNNSHGKSPSKSSMKVKERLEQRKQMIQNSDEKMNVDLVQEKIEKAKEKRLSCMKSKTNMMKDRNDRIMKNLDEQKHNFTLRTNMLKNKLDSHLHDAEERRKANIQNKLMKAQNDLEKVKLAKKKVMNKENCENVNMNNMEDVEMSDNTMMQ